LLLFSCRFCNSECMTRWFANSHHSSISNIYEAVHKYSTTDALLLFSCRFCNSECMTRWFANSHCFL